MDPVSALRQDSLTEAVEAAGIEVPPRFFESVGSTNAEALRLAEEGAPAWTVVAAGHQTAGRGRLGRSWVERPGRALLLSVLLRPAGPPHPAGLLSLLAAAALARVCRRLARVDVTCKWPNDLMVGDRKVGGVLPESRIEGSAVACLVIGAGLNVAMRAEDFPEDVRTAATSLALEGAEVDPAVVVRGYLEGLRASSDPEREGFAEEVLSAYRPLCATLGRRVRAASEGGEAVEGLAFDVDAMGSLVVETARGVRTVSFGEVAHLRNSS